MVSNIRTVKLDEYKSKYNITPEDYNNAIKKEINNWLQVGKLIDKKFAEKIIDDRIEVGDFSIFKK